MTRLRIAPDGEKFELALAHKVGKGGMGADANPMNCSLELLTECEERLDVAFARRQPYCGSPVKAHLSTRR